MGKYIVQFFLLVCLGFLPFGQVSAQFFLPWDYYNIQDDIRESGANPDFTIDGAGTIHVSYWQRAEDKLVYAWKPKGGSWSFERVDNSGRNGFKSSIELGQNDTVFIAYHEDVNGNFQVRVAQRLGINSWLIEQVPDSATQFGQGWGDYGNWTDDARTESIKQSLDLEINAAGEPRVAFFASWYNLNSVAPCGTFYQTYELQPYFAWKSGGSWVTSRIGDYQDKLNRCNNTQPLPWGDRYGEWINLLTDPSGKESIVTNAYFNREILQMNNSGNNVTWSPYVVDSQPTISNNVCCGFVILFTMESPSAAYDSEGNLHVTYTTSFVYGSSFHPNLPWYYTIVYVRIDTAGNYYQHQREPVFPEKPYRNNTHVLPLSVDTIFTTYYQGESAAFFFSASYDSGKTWATDTMLNVFSSEKAKIEKYGDTLFSVLYDEGGDRMMFGKKGISDSIWSFAPITTSQGRGEVFDAKVLSTSSDTSVHMSYTDFYEEKLYFTRGSIASGNWIGTEEEIGQGEKGFSYTSIGFGPANEPIVAYCGGDPLQLKLGIKSGGNWTYETIDSVHQVNFADVIMSPDNIIRVVYHDEDSLWLRYASRPFSGGSWTYEIIDTLDSPVGEYPDVTTDGNNQVHVVYHRSEDRSVNYALRNGANNWTTEVIASDSNLSLGRGASIEILQNGMAAIAYGDEIKFRTIFGERMGPGNWSLTTLDSSGTQVSPNPTELEIDQFGNPWVAYNYNDGFDRVKLQKRDTTTWSTVSVSTTGRIANEFNLEVVEGDLYLVGRKNKAGETGIGLLHARNGLYIAIEEEIQSKLPKVTVFPNPAHDRITFQIQNPITQNLSLEMVDLMGKYRKEVFASKWVSRGDLSIEADVSNLNPGIYFYRMTNGSRVVTGKLVILK